MPSVEEYAILLLKPDGAADARVRTAITELIKEHKLSIERRAECSLLPGSISMVTHRSEQAYARYLLSGPVEAFLVHGPDALEQVYAIKFELRQRFNKMERMENLVHAADAGNEMALLLEVFFPEVAVACRRGSADQYWVPASVDEMVRGLSVARQQHPRGIVIPVLEKELAVLDEVSSVMKEYGLQWIGVVDQSRLNNHIEIIRYLRLDHSGDYAHDGGVPALGFVHEELENYDSLMKSAAEAGLKFALCFHPAYSLFKADRLEDAASKVGLLALAGSGRAPAPFVTANGFSYMQQMEKFLADEHTISVP
jgi:hypothetical protein